MAEQPLADLIVLFGGTGDLAQKMLFPSLYNLDADGFLAEGFGIIATARAEMTREAFVAQIKDAVSARVGGGGLDPKIWARHRLLSSRCSSTRWPPRWGHSSAPERLAPRSVNTWEHWASEC